MSGVGERRKMLETEREDVLQDFLEGREREDSTTRLLVTEQISYGHRIQNHPGKCRSLHGHNSEVEVELEGRIDPETGMVADFGVVKGIIRSLDHQTLLQGTDPLTKILAEFQTIITYFQPPTAEIIATGLLERLKAVGNLTYIRVAFPETKDCIAIVEWSRDGD
jgi:6-pyruvoyltetrahydropterin/6-carboxytetrahydropterin synthase